eukprot:gene7955-8812_t
MAPELVELNASWTILIAIFAVIGNSLIIYVFCKVKSLRTVNNTFLCQLAVVDLTKAVVILPVKAHTQLHSVENLGFFCQIAGFVSTVTFVLSALLLAAVAVVRYFKIVGTRNYSKVFTKRRTVYYSIAMLAATTVLALLPIVGLGEYTYSSHHGVCFAKWAEENIAFRSLFYAFTMGLCYPVLIVCYGSIFSKLRRHRNSIVANLRVQPNAMITTSTLKTTTKQNGKLNAFHNTLDDAKEFDRLANSPNVATLKTDTTTKNISADPLEINKSHPADGGE